jgi:DNA-directed RNA polymerase subunit L
MSVSQDADMSGNDTVQEILLGGEKKIITVSIYFVKTGNHTCTRKHNTFLSKDPPSQRTLERTVLSIHGIQLPGATPKAASFQIEKEDHTLGNALRYFINKKSVARSVDINQLEHANPCEHSPDVEFCGYTIPHPSETKMHIRVQTWGESALP